MRKIWIVIIVAVIATAAFMSANWHGLDSLLSTSASVNDETDSEEDNKLRIDTIMYAGGHAFGYRGDITIWGGWYFDTIHVGDDSMLDYDSIGPSTLRLDLITKQLTVDIAKPGAAEKIKHFLAPADGFKRAHRQYEVCIDSLETEEYGTLKCMGSISIETDYADSGKENADKINRFICNLTNRSGNDSVNITALSALYAGYDPSKHHTTAYPGAAGNMSDLPDFIANKIIEGWKSNDDCSILGSMGYTLEIRPKIITPKYVTLSKYEYERAGTGHGMYTVTFHTFDLKNEQELSNDDIFKPNTLNKVTSLLFDVMAKDEHYLESNEGVKSGKDVLIRIKQWQSPSADLEGTEFEGLDSGLEFKLPEGALTDSGVIFSFQPYEIDCWAAGDFHFIVPYNKLMPYMTTKAKELISK